MGLAHKQRRRRVGLALRVLGTALALAWVLGRVDVSAAADAVGATPLWVFLLSPLGVMCNTVIQAFRVQRMLHAQAVHLSLWLIFSALCRGAFVGLVLPSGGQEVAKAAYIAKASRIDAGVAALLSARVLQLPTWVLLLIWGLIFGLARTDPLLGFAAVGFLCLSTVVLGLSIWALLRPAAPSLPIPGWTPQQIKGPLERIVQALRSLRAAPGAMAQVAVLAIPCACINIVVVWGILIGFGAPLGLTEVAALLPAADVLIWMPVSISGLGVREGLFAHFLAPRGLALSAAVAVGLTRWTGELTRAMLGGIFFIMGDTVQAGSGAEDPRRARDG